MMTEDRMEFYKEELLRIQKDLLESIVGEYDTDENPFDIDGDLADKAEIFSSVTITEGLTSSQKKTLEKIQRALHKIKEGNYGSCEVCGNDIEQDRLEAVPYAETCKEHMNNRRIPR